MASHAVSFYYWYSCHHTIHMISCPLDILLVSSHAQVVTRMLQTYRSILKGALILCDCLWPLAFCALACGIGWSSHFHSTAFGWLVLLQVVYGYTWCCDDVWPTILKYACNYPWILQLTWSCHASHMYLLVKVANSLCLVLVGRTYCLGLWSGTCSLSNLHPNCK